MSFPHLKVHLELFLPLLCLNKKTTFPWSFQSKINIFHYMHLEYFSRLHCDKGGISGSNVVFCICRFTLHVFVFFLSTFSLPKYIYIIDVFIEQLSIPVFWELLISLKLCISSVLFNLTGHLWGTFIQSQFISSLGVLFVNVFQA